MSDEDRNPHVAKQFLLAQMDGLYSELENVSRNHGKALRHVALVAAMGGRTQWALSPEQIADIVVSEFERAQRAGYTR